MSKLEYVKEHLIARQVAREKNGIKKSGKCLGDVRWALRKVGISLPWRPWPWNTAMENFKVLITDPERYGWVQVHNPLEEYPIVLAYFKKCGKLADGRVAGHVALLDTCERKHYANDTWQMNQYWADRIVGAFVPAADL